MGWRKLGDDGQELCRLIDYLVDGVQTLKSSIQMGRRLDGKGKMNVGSKELWCSGLYCDHAGNSTRPTVEDTKTALRQMKDAKSLLSSISDSLDEAIQTVTDDTSIDCRANGLSILPDDLLTYIFEIYVEMSDLSEGYVDPDTSAQILASVSKRFRQVALASSGLWKHVSFRFSRKRVLLHREKCPNPVIHIHTARELCPVEMDNFHLYPYQQWRGLRIAYNNKNEGHSYFQHLKSIVQAPLEALEDLLICNNNILGHDGERIPHSILHDDDLRTLSSWQMPNLTDLDLRNVAPLAPMHCSNVTSFSFHVFQYGGENEDLDMAAFRGLLESMPRIQSLHIFLLNVANTFNAFSLRSQVPLPDLKSFGLQIGGSTSHFVVNRVMELLVTEELTHLAFKFFPFDEEDDQVFNDWASAVFNHKTSPPRAGYKPFAKVEDFSLEIERFQGSIETFHQMFSAMPNVHTVSLVLPENTDLSFGKLSKNNRIFRRLRSLSIKLPKTYPGDFRDCLYYLDDFFRDGHCKDLERVKIKFQRTDYATSAKARLQKTLGEKLCMIEQ